MLRCTVAVETVAHGAKKYLSLRFVGVLGVTLSLCRSASAQSVTDFYRSKGLTLIVGSGVGGGYDAYGRSLSRHFGQASSR